MSQVRVILEHLIQSGVLLLVNRVAHPGGKNEIKTDDDLISFQILTTRGRHPVSIAYKPLRRVKMVTGLTERQMRMCCHPADALDLVPLHLEEIRTDEEH